MKATIYFKGIEFDIQFDYQPEEKEYFNYKEGYGHSGCPAAIEGIWEVKHKGTNFVDFLDDIYEDWETEMEERIWDALEEN